MSANVNSLSITPSQPFADFASSLTLYDSLTTKKLAFKPLNAGKVGIYVCGMTVYDYCHIGHARVMVAFDTIVRWMRHLGYDVNYVRNITDIDDKIIARALDNGESIVELTTRFIKAMQDDAAAIGCATPDAEPKATDHIDDMLTMIATLEGKKHAYPASNGDVYYAVDTFKDYGKLSKRNLDELQAGSRVDVDTDKRNPFDFVLWKAAKPQEPQWPSQWGSGRPGWHIECSAMSTKLLGNSFDIHGGGHDLQFPHHENEIAQSEAATGCNYANYWMHVGFINVDGEKMSKSLGNFFTIKEIREQFHPEVIRFFILSSHYRSQVNFSDAALKEAHAGLTRIYQALKTADAALANQQTLNGDLSGASSANDSPRKNSSPTSSDDALINRYSLDFAAAMNDDFNTPLAISLLFNLAKDINKLAREPNAHDDSATDNLRRLDELTTLLRGLSAIINIGQLNPIEFLQSQIGAADEGPFSEENIAALIQQRLDARAHKDFARADSIRSELAAAGIELEDGNGGTTWRRV